MEFAERESLLLAPYAMHSADSAGRVHPEPPHAYRSPYQRDRDRIVHSAAYRRLSHKTQVFTGELGDYHRSRLTHTLEVASLARTMARALRVNEDLVEALALGHDIGHPPFGHAGEDVLDGRLEGHGGFNHNAQALRIFELLEVRYPDFPGLNLTQEVLDGQRRRAEKTPAGELRNPIIEVQIVDASDSIAYDAHDADDALELGILQLGELRELALWDEAANRVERSHAGLSPEQLRRATVHELLDSQVSDLLGVARARLAELDLPDAQATKSAPPVAVASPEIAQKKRLLEEFLFNRVYRHPRVLAHRMEAAVALGALFDRCLARPETLPAPYHAIGRSESVERATADYLSGITDRYALEAYRKL
jgi:dGTPase